MADASFEFRINADPPSRLDKALSRDVPEDANLSRSRMAKMLEAGDISVNGVVVTNAKAKVAEGDIVRVTVAQAQESHILPQDIALDVVYEDDALIVVNKPVGMVVHPAPGTPDGTLVNALMHHCGDSLSGVGGVARPGIVHRIDKDTSGLLVVAKTDEAHHGLAKQFEAHTVERHYKALVYGVPDASDPRLRGVKGVSFEQGGVMKITTQLARHKHDRQKQAVFFTGGRHAITRARVVRSFGTPECISLVDCWLETGRTHQIRVHMAHAGHGLVGDQTYGGRRKLSEKAFGAGAVAAVKAFERQALHAATLGFEHPVSKEFLRFEAGLPPDFVELISGLTSE
ncbi:RluA family pseudouridine synthase [Lentibacter algarum]|uniref:RluA family pseudouridine synthase n=1 Tax=Lentibacter algarum TaxID=576131 RepID=UPI001C06F4FA|nr:RluA family pseudouridine synthase [Lentibacter algarum]MBU2981842.1 RluA family pseudouridine synthase [Lentibacter algarum]